LIDNCGASTIRLLTALRAEHAESKTASVMGIDGNRGAIANMVELKIFDPYLVKAQTYKTAIEAACMLLRIDEIVSGISKQDKNKQQAPEHDDETFGDHRDG